MNVVGAKTDAKRCRRNCRVAGRWPSSATENGQAGNAVEVELGILARWFCPMGLAEGHEDRCYRRDGGRNHRGGGSAIFGGNDRVVGPYGDALGDLEAHVPCCGHGSTVTLNQDLRALTPREGITAAYVAKISQERVEAGSDRLCERRHNGQQRRGDALKRLPIPIAPTNEQRRIVSGRRAVRRDRGRRGGVGGGAQGTQLLPPRAAEGRRHRRTHARLASRERASGDGRRPPKRIKEERLKRKPTKARTRRLSGETASGQGELASLPIGWVWMMWASSQRSSAE